LPEQEFFLKFNSLQTRLARRPFPSCFVSPLVRCAISDDD
jgi:hypothetical protein